MTDFILFFVDLSFNFILCINDIFSFVFCHIQNGQLSLPLILVSLSHTLAHNDDEKMEIKFSSTLVTILGYLVIALIGTASNFNSLYGDFVFDDAEAVIQNKDILPETPVINVFQNDYWGTNLKHNHSHKSYRPLTILSFRLNYLIFGGLNSWGFHLVNVVLHIVNSILLWSVFLRILGEKKVFVGFLATVLFSAHPVHSEAVCGVVGRADLLSAFFFILSFLIFSKSNVSGLCSWIWLILSMVLAGVSMFCKEQGITIIGILSIYDIVILHNLRVQKIIRIIRDLTKQKNKNSQVLTLVKRQCALISSAVFLIWLRCHLMDFQRPTFQRVDNPASFEKAWLTRVLTYNYIFSLNFWLLLCPEWLCFDWSMGCIPVVTPADFRVVFVILFWLCFGFVVAKSLLANSEKQRILLTSLALMVIPFLPASNILFTVGFVIAERILYIPSVGFCLLVACGIEVLVQSFPFNRNDLSFAFSLLVIVFLIRSFERSSDWKSEEALFNSGASVCPLNAKVHYNIAKSAVDSGDVEKAIIEYREAIRLFPEYDQALNNLANIFKSRGEVKEAENLLRKALEIRKEFPAAWMNLGIVLTQTKQYAEAEKCYQNALKYRKNYPDCHYNMGNLFLEQNRHEEAEKAWTIATKLKPTFGIAWNNLIILNVNIGNLSRAVALANEALRFIRDDAGIHFNLANALGKSGEFHKSEHHFVRALKLNPRNPQYHVNLGVLYHRWKKYRNAMECYRKALKIDPGFKSAKENLELLKKKLLEID